MNLTILKDFFAGFIRARDFAWHFRRLALARYTDPDRREPGSARWGRAVEIGGTARVRIGNGRHSFFL